MDPHVSRLVRPVTEYSAEQGSSGFSKEHLPGMDAAILLLALKQGTRSLEGYIAEYLALDNGSELPDCMLIDFFCDGLNQPLKSKVIHKGPRLSLSSFFGLCSVDCWFSIHCVIAAALEHAHKMAASAEPVHKIAATTTSCHVIAASHEPSQFTVDLHKPNQVTVDLKEPSQVIVDLRESSQVTVDRREFSQVTIDLHESSQVTSLLIIQSHVTSQLISKVTSRLS